MSLLTDAFYSRISSSNMSAHLSNENSMTEWTIASSMNDEFSGGNFKTHRKLFTYLGFSENLIKRFNLKIQLN